MKSVGKKITRLNIIRAYAVALAAATTVIIASTLGLPVSSTHVAIGGVFGVGFLREYLTNHNIGRAVDLTSLNNGQGNGEEVVAAKPPSNKKLKKAKKRKLVRRNYFLTIIAAWIITVPCAAVLGAAFFFMLRGIMVP